VTEFRVRSETFDSMRAALTWVAEQERYFDELTVVEVQYMEEEDEAWVDARVTGRVK
jgi:hypothetical protein